MPTYEYKCDACGYELEEFQSITAKPLKKCPECGKSKLKRLLGTGAGIIFKGSGFYETDYRSEGYKESAKAEKESVKPATETKNDAKASDTKASSSDNGAKPKAADKPTRKASTRKPKSE